MPKEVRRIDSSKRDSKIIDGSLVYPRTHPLVDGTVPDQYIVGRHRSEYVDYRDPNYIDKDFVLEKDLNDIKKSIVESCVKLAFELINNKISQKTKINL